jgi:hypothetical protein
MNTSNNEQELAEADIYRAESRFDETILHLFTVAETAQESITDQAYGLVEWDEAQQGNIKHILVVGLQPTGAKRQLAREVFSRGQFKVDILFDSNDEPVEKFIWCSIVPQQQTEPIEIDNGKLADEYSLIALTPTNMIKILADHINDAEGYAYLLKTMQEKSIDSYPELDAKIRRTVYDLIHEDVLSATLGTVAPEIREKVFELVVNFSDVSEDATKIIISRMTSILLKDMRGTWGIRSENDPPQETQIAANKTLEAAVRQGIIAKGSKTIARVLSYESTYRYSSGTDILYDELCDNPRATLKNMFEVKRVNFVHDYMLAVIDGRLSEGAAPNMSDVQRRSISYALSKVGRARYQDDRGNNTLSSYYNIAEMILSSDSEAAGVAKRPARRSISYLIANFAEVLDKLKPSDPDQISRYEELNKKSSEIIQTILYPVALSRMGKLAVAERVL